MVKGSRSVVNTEKITEGQCTCAKRNTGRELINGNADVTSNDVTIGTREYKLKPFHNKNGYIMEYSRRPVVTRDIVPDKSSLICRFDDRDMAISEVRPNSVEKRNQNDMYILPLKRCDNSITRMDASCISERVRITTTEYKFLRSILSAVKGPRPGHCYVWRPFYMLYLPEWIGDFIPVYVYPVDATSL